MEFPEEIEDDIYEELRIDKGKILKLKEIRDILLHPTKNGLIKILNIQSLANFDRVRGQFHRMKNEGYKLTLDLADIIEKRTNELFNNKIKTSIIIDDNDVNVPSNEKVHELEEKLAAMEELLKQTLALQNKNNFEVEPKVENKEQVEKINKPETTAVTEKRKVGRPSTKKTS